MGTRDKPPSYDDGDMGLDLDDEEEGSKDKLELPPAIKPKIALSTSKVSPTPPKTAKIVTPRSTPKPSTPRVVKPPKTPFTQPTTNRPLKSSPSTQNQDSSGEDEGGTQKTISNAQKEQIEHMEHLNRNLIQQLEEKDKQLKQILQETNINLDEIDEMTDSAAKVKIASLVKKTKTLSVALEKEKTRNAKLQAEILQQPQNFQQNEKKNSSPSLSRHTKTPLQHSPSISSPPTAENEKEVQDLRDAGLRLSKQVSELKDKLMAAQNETRNLRRALQRELGDGVDINKIIDDSTSNWKGRAQQITLLKAKISELSSTSEPKQKSGGPSIDEFHKEEISQLAADRRQEFEKLSQENESIREEFQRQKLKLDAKESRIKILETKCQDLQEKIKIVLDKTNDDDQLIALLKKEITKLKGQEKIIKKI
eukprot:Phypoly_transcript_09921.p1 GENE.Phypoly_transcript_09921~~Phypoly_transcript_09921.p1  ORF type:complete len:423 (+),score=114.03 Phypoly_transcript_09921:56-1324(+)